MRAVSLPCAQGLGAPGCNAVRGVRGAFEFVAGAPPLLLAELRDISTTAAVTATSTAPMMMKGSGLFDFAGAFLGLRLIQVATVRKIFLRASRGPPPSAHMVTPAPPPAETVA